MSINDNDFKGVKVFKNAITNKDCEYLINFLNKTEDSYGRTESKSLRKISLRPESENIKNILLMFLEKAKEVYQEKDLFISSYMISSYIEGFEMKPHIDTEDERDFNKISIVVYLNNDFLGGDIVFPLLDYTHTPEKGDAVLFLSGLRDNLHGVQRITSGVRYVMPIFITDKAENAYGFIHNK